MSVKQVETNIGVYNLTLMSVLRAHESVFLVTGPQDELQNTNQRKSLIDL